MAHGKVLNEPSIFTGLSRQPGYQHIIYATCDRQGRVQFLKRTKFDDYDMRKQVAMTAQWNLQKIQSLYLNPFQ
jgi:hypothetical protein